MATAKAGGPERLPGPGFGTSGAAAVPPLSRIRISLVSRPFSESGPGLRGRLVCVPRAPGLSVP